MHMKKPSKEAIARACLIAYVILLLPSPLLLGDPTEWWITSAFALIPAIMLGSQKQRIIAGVFVAFTLVVALVYIHHVANSGATGQVPRL
jgi:hypothetical protein